MGNELSSLCCGERGAAEAEDAALKIDVATFGAVRGGDASARSRDLVLAQSRGPVSPKPAQGIAIRAKASALNGGESSGLNNSWQKKECNVCWKIVYMHDKALNSREQAFHKACLRCATCGASLAGKEPVPESGPSLLQSSQYRAAVCDGLAVLHCAKHGSAQVREVVVGTPRMAKRESHVAVCTEPEVKAQVTAARDQLELIVGDQVPTCAKCGGAFASSENLVLAGMLKSHRECPKAEDGVTMGPASAIRCAKRAAPRLAVRVSAHGERSAPVPDWKTFLFELDGEARDRAIRSVDASSERATLAIPYPVDPQSRSAWARGVGDLPDGVERSFSAEVLEASFSPCCPHDAEPYEPLVGIQFHGWVSVQNERVYMSIGFDGELVYAPTRAAVLGGVNVSRASVNLFRTSVRFMALEDDDRETELRPEPSEAAPGFCLCKVGKSTPFLKVYTRSWLHAAIWAQAAMRVQGLLRPAQDGYERVAVHLFAAHGGIVQRLELTLQFSPALLKLGCLDAATLFVSHLDPGGAPLLPSLADGVDGGAFLPPGVEDGVRYRRRSSSGSSRGFVKEKLRLWGEKFLGEEINDFVNGEEDGPILSPRSAEIVKTKLKTWVSSKLFGATEDAEGEPETTCAAQPLSPRTHSLVSSRIDAWARRIDAAKADGLGVEQDFDHSVKKSS